MTWAAIIKAIAQFMALLFTIERDEDAAKKQAEQASQATQARIDAESRTIEHPSDDNAFDPTFKRND